MKVIKLSAIDWLLSLSTLSIGSFYLLNVLDRCDIDVTDEEMMNHTGMGVSTHRKYKRELMDKGYLGTHQVGKSLYAYTIGDKNGKD